MGELRRASIVLNPEQWDAERGQTAILFHGLTGTPCELELLGEAIVAEGYRVLIPCLPGHASSVEELRKTPLAIFLSAVDDVLAVSRRPFVVGGISFGSLLALRAAEQSAEQPRAVILLSPPFKFRSRRREIWLEILSRLPEPLISLLGYSPKAQRKLSLERKAYKKHSVGAAARLLRLRRTVKRGLKQLLMPILIVQDPFDHHLDPDGAEKIVEEFGSAEVDTIWLPRAEHELLLGPEREKVTQAAVAFLRRAADHAA